MTVINSDLKGHWRGIEQVNTVPGVYIMYWANIDTICSSIPDAVTAGTSVYEIGIGPVTSCLLRIFHYNKTFYFIFS